MKHPEVIVRNNNNAISSVMKMAAKLSNIKDDASNVNNPMRSKKGNDRTSVGSQLKNTKIANEIEKIKLIIHKGKVDPLCSTRTIPNPTHRRMLNRTHAPEEKL